MTTNPNNAPGQELGRKLSARSFGWDKEHIQEAVIKDKENDHFLYRVIGTIGTTKAYKSRQLDPDTKEALEGFGLLGMFEATGSDGTVLTGSTLYLPGYVTDAIVGAIHAGDGEVNVRIAYDVYARYDKESITSYVFIVRSLIAPDTSALDDIKKLMGDVTLPALPAPKK